MKYTEAKKLQSKHICVFGEPKTGKSLLTAKLALAGYKLVWISLDGGHTVIDQLPESAQENIDLIQIPDTQEYPIASETVNKIFTGAELSICDMHAKDGCTGCKQRGYSFTAIHLNRLPLDHVVVLDHASQFTRSLKFKIGIGDDKDVEGDENFVRYRKLAWGMDKLLSNIQAARYNVVLLAHVIEAKTDDGQKRLYPYMGSANHSSTVGGYFDHVLYCEVINKSHRFGSSSQYKASVMTGSRTNIHIEDMKEPSLVPFFKSLEEIQRTQVEASGVVEALTEARDNLRTIDSAQEKLVTVQKSAASELLARMRK